MNEKIEPQAARIVAEKFVGDVIDCVAAQTNPAPAVPDGGTLSILSRDELSQCHSKEDIINALLKKKGLNRRARRIGMARSRKPGRKARH